MSGSLNAQSAALTTRYFDANYYINNNPDVFAAVISGRTTALQHFINGGFREGRNPFSSFDTKGYLLNNPDVQAAVGQGRITAWEHFVNGGILENRSNGLFTGYFNESAYLAANPDVAAAVKSGSLRSGYEHWLNGGSREGRTAVNTAGETIGSQPGQTFTLTDSPDNVVGTNGNDTITGVAGETLTAVDVINGGAGVDTLNITTTSGGDVLRGALISNVEVVGIRSTSDSSLTLNASLTPGLTGVNLTGTNANPISITNLANNATVTVGAGASVNGTLGVGYVAAATTANVAYAGGTSGAVNVAGAGITTANISSSGAANTAGAIDVAGATTINIAAAANFTAASIATTGANSTMNVSGAAASVSVGLLDSDLRTINASGLTAGGLTATLSNAAQVVTGGAGNDVIRTGGIGLTGSVNAGAGTADRLVVSTSGDLTAATGSRYSGFEVLELANGVVANASQVAGITGVVLNGGGSGVSVTDLNATQAGAVILKAAGAGDVTIAVAGAATPGQVDTVALTVSNEAAAVNTLTLGGNLVLASVENLSINAVDNFVVTGLGGANSAALQSITLTGAATQSVTLGNGTFNNFAVNGSGATGSLTIDASAYTQALSITGGSGADTITGSNSNDVISGGGGNDALLGGAGNDTITGGDGNDTITGGVGADNLTGNAGADTFSYTTLNNSLAAAPDRITDFVAGTDKIDVTTVPSVILQGANFTTAGTGTLANDISSALAAGGGVFTPNSVAVVTITGAGAGTYLVVNDGTSGYADGTDAVVNITGLTGTLSLTDFI